MIFLSTRSPPVVVQRRPYWSQKLLEALMSASADDHHAPIGCRPHDGASDVRLSGDRSEAIPDRRLERIVELVTPTPALDVEQLIALDLTQDDPADTAAAAGAAAERHGRDRRAAPLELGPYVVARDQLVSTRGESRLVDPRCLAAGGCPIGRARGRLALRARPRSPSACDVEGRRLRGCSMAPREPASRTRRRPTRRAPLLEPQRAIAHHASGRRRATQALWLRSVGIGRTRRSAAAGPAETRVSPGDSEGERGSAARPLRVH